MKITSPKDLKINKMFEYKNIFLKKYLEFLNNKHKHMKVVDALGQIC
jgi:hypothetical protein